MDFRLVTTENKAELWQWLIDTDPEMAKHIQHFKKVFGSFEAIAMGEKRKEKTDAG